MNDAPTPDRPAAAATVVLVRDAAADPAVDAAPGIEVLLLERPDHGSFARAWVFPGGKVDPEDAPGEHADVAAQAAAVRETLEETGLVVEPDALAPLARWTPPPNIPRRFDTWFFLAAAPGGEVVLSPDEVVSHRWVAPADALALHAERALTLFPPTWVTLHQLVAEPSVDAALAHARAQPIPHFTTMQAEADRMVFWAGDERFDGGTDTDAGPRHRLVMDALPWRYERR